MLAEVDSRGIHRILLNLLNNAVDAVMQCHGESGNGLINVSLYLENQGQTMVLKVKDNGSGIPPENLKKVFEMFFSGKGESGSGLGLAVSKRIVENHRGTISVENQKDKGADFVVKLPIRQQESITGYIPQRTAFGIGQSDRTRIG